MSRLRDFVVRRAVVRQLPEQLRESVNAIWKRAAGLRRKGVPVSKIAQMLFGNWKTTVSGLLQSVLTYTIAAHVPGVSWWAALGAGLLTAIRGIVAKDSDVTGTTAGAK